MKASFKILKDRPKIKFKVTRDSVCAADDVDAPHEKIIKIHSFTEPLQLATQIGSSYLPSVNGSGHSWTCRLNGTSIARIGYNINESHAVSVEYLENNTIHFSYHS